MSTQNNCPPLLSNSPHMTIIWLIFQLICFPIVLAILSIHVIYSFTKSHWNGYLSAFTLALYILYQQLPALFLWLPIPSLYLTAAAIILPTCYIMSNLLDTYRLTALLLVISIISIHYWLATSTWFGPITLHSLLLLVNALCWSALSGVAIAQNLYSAYYPKLTSAEQRCITDHLLAFMVSSKKTHPVPMTRYDYWHAFAIFSVQSKYEALLQQSEQAYIKTIQACQDNNEKNFLLCKLIHVMCSDKLTLQPGETLTKRSLLPSRIKNLAGDFYFYTLETEKESTIVFSGTSFLPNPCPSVFWSVVGNMTPGCSVGYPLLWLGKTTIEQFLQSEQDKKKTIRFTGFSMGGSFAKLANIELTLDDCQIDTFNSPGLLTWQSRSCYTLALALLSATTTCLHAYIVTAHYWPPLLSASSLIALSVITCLVISSSICFSFFLKGEDSKIFSMKNVRSFINAADCIANVASQPLTNMKITSQWYNNPLSTHLQSPIGKE